MLKRCLIIFSLIASLFVQPIAAKAASLDQTLKSLGVEVAIDPSQSSASALLELPSVYAVPGSFVYWLQSVVEQVQYILSSTPESRAQLLLDFSQQRLAEGYKAVQDNNPQAAIDALTKYQQQQQELSGYINLLGLEDVEVKPYLDKLQQQLGIQQALEEYVEQQLKDQPDLRNRVTSLLQVQPTQLLAFKQAQQTVVLGQRYQRPSQTSPSASPSASPAD